MNSAMQVLNSGASNSVLNATDTQKKKKTNSASSLNNLLNELNGNSPLKVGTEPIEFNKIKNISDVYMAIDHGLISEIELVNTKDYPENNYAGYTGYTLILKANKDKVPKGFFGFLNPFSQTESVYIGDRSQSELQSLEKYCKSKNLSISRVDNGSIGRSAQDVFKRLMTPIGAILFSVGIAMSVKQYKIAKIKMSLGGYERDSFENTQKGIIGDTNIRDKLLGYSEKIYTRLEDVDRFCEDFKDNTKKYKGEDIGTSLFLTGPPGTGKTYLANLVANHIIDKAKEANKKLLVLDVRDILNRAGVNSLIQEKLFIEPTAEDYARIILAKAEKGGYQGVLLRSDDAGVGGKPENVELSSMLMADIAKQMRDTLKTAQKQGHSALGKKRKDNKPTCIEFLSFVISTNAQSIAPDKNERKRSYAEEAQMARLGHVIVVKNMENDQRPKFIKKELKQYLKLTEGESIPDSFANFLFALTAEYTNNNEGGASTRDYIEEGNIFSQIRSMLSSVQNKVLWMKQKGDLFEQWLNNQGNQALDSSLDVLVRKIINPLANREKIPFSNSLELNACKAEIKSLLFPCG